LAQLPKAQLQAYLARHLAYGPEAVSAIEPRWRVLGKAKREAISMLAGWLGVDFV